MSSVIRRESKHDLQVEGCSLRPLVGMFRFLVTAMGLCWLALGTVRATPRCSSPPVLILRYYRRPILLHLFAVTFCASIFAGCANDMETSQEPVEAPGGKAQSATSKDAPRFKSVSVSLGRICAIRLDDTLMCWGWSRGSNHQVPEGEFHSISASGYDYACGLRKDQQIVCWGDFTKSSPGTTNEGFQSVSAGPRHSCAVGTDGTAYCWGQGSGFRAGRTDSIMPPDGVFQSVTAGRWHSCGLRPDGTVQCWGQDWGGSVSAALQERFQSISAGDGNTCGVKIDGEILCWGRRYGDDAPRWSFVIDGTPTPERALDPPAGEFRSVSVAGGFFTDEHLACAIRIDDELVCWSAGYWIENAPPGKFDSVSVGSEYACGLRQGGELECWTKSDNELPQWAAIQPGRAYRSVAIGAGLVVCVVTVSDALACSRTEGTEPPDGAFQMVAGSETHLCSLKIDGSVHCWGGPEAVDLVPPMGEFQTVSVGPAYACGVMTDSSLKCWGDDPVSGGEPAGLVAPPEGSFRSATAGRSFACGVTTDDRAVCWGGRYGDGVTRDGPFAELAIYGPNVCGLRTDQSVLCWAPHHSVESTRPEGLFKTLSTGQAEYACGLLEDLSPRCWPEPDVSGVIDDLSQFQSVAVGGRPGSTYRRTCGILTDGGLKCWSQSEIALVLPSW